MANATIRSLITKLDSLKEASMYVDSVKLGWINEVDGAIWHEIYKRASKQEIMRTDGTAAYSLEEGKEFQHITKVYNDGSELPRLKDPRPQTTGYFRGSDGKLNIYPVPAANDSVAGLVVLYREPYEAHEADDIETDTVLAEPPFDKMYMHYMSAMVNHTRREYAAYNEDLALFNASFEEYRAWWNKTEGAE